MELFYQEGPSIIHQIKEKGHHIFLDLKLHDIPNTVKSAMKGLARLECDLVNVHAAGGKEMMAAAFEGLEAGLLRTEAAGMYCRNTVDKHIGRANEERTAHSCFIGRIRYELCIAYKRSRPGWSCMFGLGSGIY